MTDQIVMTRTSTDVANERRADARYIGDINDGTYRIDLSSALTKNDREDNYRFRVRTPDTFVRLFALEQDTKNGVAGDSAPDGAVRYQLMNSAGRVIADSDHQAGDAFKQYQDLIGNNNLKLQQGTYNLRVTRGANGDSSKDYVYNLALRGNWQPLKDGAPDNSLRVFSTTESPASTAASALSLTPPPNVFSTLGTTDGLGTLPGVFINTLA
jgi:hypothetical protein